MWVTLKRGCSARSKAPYLSEIVLVVPCNILWDAIDFEDFELQCVVKFLEFWWPKFWRECFAQKREMRKSFLSHKLRYYTSLSGPEKSRNNTRDKNIVFFLRVLI